MVRVQNMIDAVRESAYWNSLSREEVGNFVRDVLMAEVYIRRMDYSTEYIISRLIYDLNLYFTKFTITTTMHHKWGMVEIHVTPKVTPKEELNGTT